jgi:DNA-binding IclR family transcriptional regulator
MDTPGNGISDAVRSDGRPRPRYPIESVDNVLRLLALFRDRGSVRVLEASRELGVAGSTAHRLLAMLEYHDFVARDARTRDYVPGAALMALGLNVARGSGLRTAAVSEMEALAAETNETVSLAVLFGTEVVFVESVESLRAVRVTSMAGAVFPAHTASAGKVLLAELSADELEQRFPDDTLPGGTDRAIKTKRELVGELAEIRAQGYALNRGESDALRGSIAVCLRDDRGQAPGSLSISMPLVRFNAAAVDDLHVRLSRAAARIRDRLHSASRERGV